MVEHGILLTWGCRVNPHQLYILCYCIVTIMCQEIWKIYTQHKWINPLEPLPLLYYKEKFMHFSELSFILQPKYWDMFLPNALRVAIGQLRVSSHQVEIENGRANGIPKEERIYRLCHIDIEDEYQFTCKCSTRPEEGWYQCESADRTGMFVSMKTCWPKVIFKSSIPIEGFDRRKDWWSSGKRDTEDDGQGIWDQRAMHCSTSVP